MIDLCFLGTGGSIPMPERALASLYVRTGGKALLIDCGEGTQMQIMKLGWGFRCIDGLLLTHYHADHCSGLPGFLLAQAKASREAPLHVYGPAGLRRVLDGLRVICPQLPYPLVMHEITGEESSFPFIGMDITPFPLDHGMPCLGYAFSLPRIPAFLPEKARALGIPLPLWKHLQRGESVTYEGRLFAPKDVQGPPRSGLSFLYATDTRPTPRIVSNGRHTDLMILEGMYGEEEKLGHAMRNHHMLYRESAALAQEAETKELILTHFSTSMETPDTYLSCAQAVFPATRCATDLMTYTLRFPERR